MGRSDRRNAEGLQNLSPDQMGTATLGAGWDRARRLDPRVCWAALAGGLLCASSFSHSGKDSAMRFSHYRLAAVHPLGKVTVAILLCSCRKEELLEVGADTLQAKKPIEQLNMHLNGFHYASGNLAMQTEADHYCTRAKDGFTQCVIYDGTGRDARMVGIEHIVTREMFGKMPAEERAYWHPHTYEVLSGTLIAPNIPAKAEHELMEILVSTYGKTWHLWHPKHDPTHPAGCAALMKGFTKEGQLDVELLKDRDRRFKIDYAEKKASRADIGDPGFDPIVLEEPKSDCSKGM